MGGRCRPARRRLAAAALTLLLWPVAVLPGAGPAVAHTALISCEPAADASLTSGPGRVSATFNEELQPAFAAMTVVGPDRNLWSEGTPEVRGAVVSTGVRRLGPAGRYTVNYRVTSADGHVVTGSWSFEVTTAATATPGPSAPEPTRERIPLWPFGFGAALLVVGAAVWTLRRRA